MSDVKKDKSNHAGCHWRKCHRGHVTCQVTCLKLRAQIGGMPFPAGLVADTLFDCLQTSLFSSWGWFPLFSSSGNQTSALFFLTQVGPNSTSVSVCSVRNNLGKQQNVDSCYSGSREAAQSSPLEAVENCTVCAQSTIRDTRTFASRAYF